ncbi:MAG TPA: hypothetical protein VMT87_11390 [Vicinamibacteria bacterium]|nr:hypothetical protein [Vicinamibacteria bacterium]
MPIACHDKTRFGPRFCLTGCTAAPGGGFFDYARVEAPSDVPPADPRVVDVAVLDMNHGWPNLGHDSLVHAVQDAACDLISHLRGTGLRVRAISYDVRRRHAIPEPPGGRFALYVGTGGPGHIDPHRNDGGPGTQGIVEDPGWERPLFSLFDRVRGSHDAALVAVCHTFGVMCRWSGVARPVLRPAEKGGKSAGILENLLTAEATRHPWFGRLADELPDRRRLPVLDHRLYDLVPEPRPLPRGALAIGYETRGIGGPQGEALTMLEFARDEKGEMPRVFAVNHHPEIVDLDRQRLVLQRKRERGEVTPEWFEERQAVLEATHHDPLRDRRLHATSDYTLLGPLRFHLYRQVRRRAEALDLAVDLHEDEVLAQSRPAV